MSKKINTLAKFVMAAGVVLLTTIRTNLTPANAAQVNFSFTTNNKQGSFVLDTSSPDQLADNRFGYYIKAIQNYTFDGSEPLTTDLYTYQNEPEITTLSLDFLSVFNFNDSSGQLINQLSSDPSVYNTSFVVGAVYDFNNESYVQVNTLNAVPVPEPTIMVSSLVALGMGWQMKRKMKKGDLSASDS